MSAGDGLGCGLPLEAQLLGWLRSGGGGLVEVAERTGVSLAQVEAGLQNLQAAGFEVERHPTLGWRLVGEPASLIGDAVLSRMRLLWVAAIRVYRSTDSTNELAMRAGWDGERDPLVIFAESQTAGRGRFGRAWHSAAGEGIWMSVLLRPKLPVAEWARLSGVAALAVAGAVEKEFGLEAQIKWPNDVVVRGKKVCGVLVESVHGRGAPFVVLGVGVNANQSEFPEELRERATSLRMELGRCVERASLAAAILDGLGELLGRCGDGFAEVVRELERRSSLLGRAVVLRGVDREVQGIAEGLDELGQLRVRMGDGRVEVFSAGEVTLGRLPGGEAGGLLRS
jgi:BirA family biotin operon repressor/biotin-[acetyl-CoA-carboxylase] ligase